MAIDLYTQIVYSVFSYI